MTLVLVAVAAILFSMKGQRLILSDRDTHETYAAFPVSDGEEFSVTFVHSVNKTPVTDVYEIRDGDIWLIKTIYYDFGAGVPTETEKDETLTYGENGEMIISGMDTMVPDLIYIVGTVSDHVLETGGKEYSLRGLCGRNSHVLFSCKG
ncbi:MAG: DUF1850 domain-containing protein [Oscillospiraceae bacterium]